jgi:hypothetical protein
MNEDMPPTADSPGTALPSPATALPLLSPEGRARYDKRLAILVPYRDRAVHLARFLPHMATYFAQDKLDSAIDYTIHIVEQAGTRPFNKGRLLNAGFTLVRDQADYVCLHDVDYLPLWSDYSYPDGPTRLIWYGLRLREDYERFFGAVVMLPVGQFVTVNGFSSGYWRWGPEDMEFLDRCITVGLKIVRRDGTFGVLHHPHNGLNQRGGLSEAAIRNGRLYRSRLPDIARVMKEDGLTTAAAFKLIESKTPAGDPAAAARVRRHLIDIGEPSDASG